MANLRDEIHQVAMAIKNEWKKDIIKKQTKSIDEYTDDIISIIGKRILQERMNLSDKTITNMDMASGWNLALEQLKWKIEHDESKRRNI